MIIDEKILGFILYSILFMSAIICISVLFIKYKSYKKLIGEKNART